MPRCRYLARAVLLIGSICLLPDRATCAQGRWEVNGGVFHNVLDSMSRSGVTASFARWPRSTRALRRGFRLEFLSGRQDQERLPAWPEVPLSPYSLIFHTWSAWGVSAGIPFQVGPTDWPIRPFAEADPGLLIYRSSDETRYTRRTPTVQRVYVEDASAWRIGPTLGIGAGFEVPGRGGSVRLKLRGGVSLRLVLRQRGDRDLRRWDLAGLVGDGGAQRPVLILTTASTTSSRSPFPPPCGPACWS